MALNRLVATFVLGSLTLAIAACGGSSSNNSSSNTPGSPSGSGSTCSSFGPLGGAKGTITASISGSTFNGGIPTGLAIYTPVAAVPALGIPAQDFFVISGTCGDSTSLQITALATTGTTNIGVDGNGNPLRNPQTQQPLVHNVLLQYRANGVAAGTWYTGILGGSGSVTVTSVSTSAAVGSFSLTMVPQAGTGATGNKTVTGQFSTSF
jgi:hypothetical protein